MKEVLGLIIMMCEAVLYILVAPLVFIVCRSLELIGVLDKDEDNG